MFAKAFVSFLGLLFVLSAGTSWGAVVAGWDVVGVELDVDGAGTNATAPFSFSAISGDSRVTAALTLGDGVTSSTSSNQYGFKVPGVDQQATLAGAIANNHYFQFSLTVDPGYYLNLNSIEMNGQSSGDGANSVALLSSVGGFIDSSVLASRTGIAGATGGFDTDGSGFGGPINLNMAGFQQLTGTVAFRLYGFDTTSGSGVTFLRNLSGNDLVVNGSVTAVPEPSSIALLGIGSLAMVAFRRRRQQVVAVGC
ncbi:PEP-CTERM motif protein [Neorhodopirellula pilleata]|uniref:PEP-CTERM motif protein n=2 Tax=Neorhodopirellula pilleata TaxID=2714738 RepID=A0A5C6ADH1_9BACT|nr:PEP-CTERM motif protein [Neorhodopirellula pilleata]